MKSFKLNLMIGVAMVSVAGCNGYKKGPVDPPAGPPDHTKKESDVVQHDSSACPLWNGEYVGITGIHKRMRIDYDQLGSLIVEDLTTGSTWVVNGKPQWINGSPKNGAARTSYSAYCAPNLPLNNDKSQTFPGIKIDVYADAKPSFSVTYVANLTAAGDPKGNSFDFNVENADGSHTQKPDTFRSIDAAPLPIPPPPPPPPPAPTPAPTPSPTH